MTGEPAVDRFIARVHYHHQRCKLRQMVQDRRLLVFRDARVVDFHHEVLSYPRVLKRPCSDSTGFRLPPPSRHSGGDHKGGFVGKPAIWGINQLGELQGVSPTSELFTDANQWITGEELLQNLTWSLIQGLRTTLLQGSDGNVRVGRYNLLPLRFIDCRPPRGRGSLWR